MNSLSVKKGDNVLVIAGKDKGKTGEVLTVSPITNTVTVKGINIITKHKKPRSAKDKGGIETLEGKINASNVQVICSACGKATRIAHKKVDGKKVRVCKKCGAILDAVKGSTKKTAKKSTKKAEAKTADKETATKKSTTAKKSTASKSTAKKSTAKKTTTKKTSTKKSTAKKTTTKKTATKKAEDKK